MHNYRKQKTDANQAAIVSDLRKRGVRVEVLGDPLDLLCWFPKTGHFGFIEVKIAGSSAKYTRVQVLYLANTTLPVAIAHNSDEAMNFLKTGKGITQRQKDALAAFLLRHKDRFFTPKEIGAVLNA